MTAEDRKLGEVLVREETRHQLNAEHLLEAVLKRRRYSSLTRDEIASILTRAGRGLPHADGREILERIMRRTRYSPELLALVDAALAEVAAGRQLRTVPPKSIGLKPKRDSYSQRIVAQLALGPKTLADLAAKTGVEASKLKGALEGLKRRGRIVAQRKVTGERVSYRLNGACRVAT